MWRDYYQNCFGFPFCHDDLLIWANVWIKKYLIYHYGLGAYVDNIVKIDNPTQGKQLGRAGNKVVTVAVN